MEWIGEAHFIGDLLDGDTGRLQAIGGVVHFQAKEELIGAGVIEAAEQAAEVGGIDVAGAGDLLEGLDFAGVIEDPAEAFLVRDEGWGAE